MQIPPGIFVQGIAFFHRAAYTIYRRSSILGSARKGRAQIDGALSLSHVPKAIGRLPSCNSLRNAQSDLIVRPICIHKMNIAIFPAIDRYLAMLCAPVGNGSLALVS